MATQNPFSKMYDIEVVGGDQRTRLAEMLRANALNAPQGQMVSGWYVPPSWSQNLNHALQTAVGTWGGIAAEDAEREAEQRDFEKMRSAKMGQAVRDYGQPKGTPTDQALTPAYPSSPAAGTVESGEFRAMKTGGMQSMPNYSVAPQQQPQQPQFDLTDPRQFESRMGRQFARQNMMQQFATPEYSQTPQYDQSGRAFVLDKAGNMKYLGGDQSPVRKADYNELIYIDPTTGKPAINPLALQAKSMVSRAGAANVSVNTGQRGFDNTLKLRSDFRSEPTYKAFQEVQSAWDKVRTSSERATPASDLATATKFMKILDEGSVVRESELGLALAATGVEDKLKNYANNILTGQKLNPAQRKDFRETAQLFYNEAAKRYNGKRNEYADIAGRNQLNVEDVVGPEIKLPKQVVRTGKDKSGRTVYQYSDGSTGYGN